MNGPNSVNGSANTNASASVNGSASTNASASGWTSHPSLRQIDAAKLQALLSLAEQGRGKTQNELLSFLMTAASQSGKNGVSFSNEETDLILNVLKQGRSPQEAARIDQIVSLVRQMHRR